MSRNKPLKPTEIRKRLGHPVIDADGHFIEMDPVLHAYFLDYAREIGGTKVIERFKAQGSGLTFYGALASWHKLTEAQIRDTRPIMPAFWTMTANTIDRAAGYLPRLMHERLEEIGIDFAVLYPSHAMRLSRIKDDELRGVAVRALNKLVAEMYLPYADRLTPVAVIPMLTPREAIAELEYVVRELGFKAVVTNGIQPRPLPLAERESPKFADLAGWTDVLAMDSIYDYDPVWAKCEELRVAVASHAGGGRSVRSPTSYVYNHIGQFGAGADMFCRALFLGGVTRRFPNLRFAFLEGGVAWACTLYAGLVSHWQKRGRGSIERLDPKNVDVDLMLRLVDKYGDERVRSQEEALRGFFSNPEPLPKRLDEFAAAKIANAEDLRDLFVPRFFFGCEADDPSVAWAFDTRINPLGARLQPMLGSDIGHWDVPDMSDVLGEAYELVEHGVLEEEEFEEFTFSNAVRLYTSLNPDFFKGTVVESTAAKVKIKA